jgi:hypothetical protein
LVQEDSIIVKEKEEIKCCSVQNCKNKIHARGLCMKDYNHIIREQLPLLKMQENPPVSINGYIKERNINERTTKTANKNKKKKTVKKEYNNSIVKKQEKKTKIKKIKKFKKESLPNFQKSFTIINKEISKVILIIINNYSLIIFKYSLKNI